MTAPWGRLRPGSSEGGLRRPPMLDPMAAKKQAADGEEGFEAHLEALEEAVRALESDELTLEDSLSRYQQGVTHLSACRTLLDDAEARLAELVGTTEAGDLEERPLRATERGLEDASEG